MDGYRRTGGRTRCSIPPVVSNLRRGTYATQRVNIVPEGGTFGVSMYRPLSRLVEHSASPATRRSKRRLSHDKFGRSRKANEHSVVYFDHRPSVFLFSRPRRRRSRLNTTMRFQSSILLLLYAATLASEVQRAEECRQGAGDELIWEYDVRRPYRNGGYQEVEADYGPTEARITCIRVDSLSEEDNGAAWVTSGGIGYNFVRLKFRSKYSKGLHYRVFVYGQPTLKGSTPRLP